LLDDGNVSHKPALLLAMDRPLEAIPTTHLHVVTFTDGYGDSSVHDDNGYLSQANPSSA
jgi:hypothetical protein